jgi:hypothetical protein
MPNLDNILSGCGLGKGGWRECRWLLVAGSKAQNNKVWKIGLALCFFSQANYFVFLTKKYGNFGFLQRFCDHCYRHHGV